MWARPALPVVLAAVTLACAGVYHPPRAALTDAALRDAWRLLERASERLAVFEVTEDGYLLHAYELDLVDIFRYADIEEPERDPTGVRSGWETRFPDRAWAGPRFVYVRFGAVRAVHAKRWPLGAGVLLGVDGRDSPALFEVEDFETACRLADALELLRRVRAPSDLPSFESLEPPALAP